MDFSIIKKTGEKKSILLSNIFDTPYNEILIHQLIISYLGNSHNCAKKHKSRSEVRGGGKKPWKQKGTGKARAGSIRSPLWRGGGKIFAANGHTPIKRKINKKMYKLGMKIIFSELFRSNRINIIDDMVILNSKTKTFLNEVAYLNITKPTLFIVDNICLNIYLSTRNLKNISIISFKKLNPIILLKFKSVFITENAIKGIEECFK